LSNENGFLGNFRQYESERRYCRYRANQPT
jgi:hypothetical protein